MKEVRLIMLIRSGVGFLTKYETEAYRDFINMDAEGTDDEPIACGAPLNGPAVPIPGINRNGNMVSIVETDWTPEEITQRLSEVDDYLPTLAIDITDQVENGTISINAQMASESVGSMLQEVVELVPTGEYDEEAEQERSAERRAKIKSLKSKRGKGHSSEEDDCDCPSCEMRREIKDKLGGGSEIHEFPGGMGIGIDMDDLDGLDGLDGIKDIIGKILAKRGLGDAFKESLAKKGGGTAKKYKRKSCKLDMNQLLDLIKERGGVDKLEDNELQRLEELSKNF